MKKGRLFSLCGPLGAVTLSLALLIPIFTSLFSPTLNTYFGKGELVKKNNLSEGRDTSYYQKKSKEEALSLALETNEEIAKEGIVLLKNGNGCLPLSKDDILSPFGYAYSHPSSLGGSSNWSGREEEKDSLSLALKESFSVNGKIEGITKDEKNVLSLKSARGSSKVNQAKEAGGTSLIYTIKADSYSGREKERKNTIGLRVISRDGGENSDFKRDGYESGERHALSLTREEKKTLQIRKQNCRKSILLYTGVNPIEFSDDVTSLLDAILYLPSPGSGGYRIVDDVLLGHINPSGKTVDTFVKDFLSIPSSVNFGLSGTKPYDGAGRYFDNVTQRDNQSKVSFVSYKEGIYVGYRYYETADREKKIDYDSLVAYPFGYGLSYTSFDQELISYKEENGSIQRKVKVTNKGERAGKDAVEIYYGAPYSGFDRENGIEKAGKNLIAFSKTSLLKPGESEVLSLSFALEDRASYFSSHQNSDSTFGCYFLEEGDYTIYLGKNSHESYDQFVYHVSDSVFYDNTNPRQSEKDAQSRLDQYGNPVKEKKVDKAYVAATNRFSLSTEYRKENHLLLSRKDFSSTYPSFPKGKEYHLDEKYKSVFDSYKNFSSSHPLLGDEEGSLVYDSSPLGKARDSSLTLSSMRGESYDSEKWDALLSKISFTQKEKEQLGALFGYGAYQSGAVDTIGKFSTEERDGPNGYSTFGQKKNEAFSVYASETLTACTFNSALAYKRGKARGVEGRAHDVQGLYAPGRNIHRSPFGGRNGEYVSEDPLRCGVIGAKIVSGAADYGVYTYRKHFALNEQESGRGDRRMVFSDEQTIREIYLKPFEICLKKARRSLSYLEGDARKETKIRRAARGIRTSFNGIGPVRNCRNYALNTNVLREEWGFNGAVISDYGVKGNRDAMMRSGNDVYRTAFSGFKSRSLKNLYPLSASLSGKHVVLKSLKNVCYRIVNSGAFDGLRKGEVAYRKKAAWEIYLNDVLVISLYVITFALFGMGIGHQVILWRRKKQGSPPAV